MQPVEMAPVPGTKPVIMGQMQEQYGDLPALMYPEGCILTSWELTPEERDALIKGANIQLWIWNFGGALQPVALQVDGIHYDEN